MNSKEVVLEGREQLNSKAKEDLELQEHLLQTAL